MAGTSRKPHNPRQTAATSPVVASGAAASPDDDAEVKDTAVKAPSSPVPNDRETWGGPGSRVGETNQDPLGVGTNPSNTHADPTDTRAVGRQSARTMEVRQRLADGKPEDHPTQSPSTAGQRVTATGLAAAPDMGRKGEAASGFTVLADAPIKARDIEVLEDETVRLTAPHYLNDVVYDKDAILEGYHGPKSQNMVVVGREQYTTAEDREKSRLKFRERKAA